MGKKLKGKSSNQVSCTSPAQAHNLKNSVTVGGLALDLNGHDAKQHDLQHSACRVPGENGQSVNPCSSTCSSTAGLLVLDVLSLADSKWSSACTCEAGPQACTLSAFLNRKTGV